MDKQVANVQLMQKMNRLKVLSYIRRNPDCSRPIIAEGTGLSLASLTNVTSYLLGLGLLTESGTESVGRVGRKSMLLRFCEDAYKLICIFFTEECINIYVTNLTGVVTDKISASTVGLSAEEAVFIAKEKAVALANDIGREHILCIGVAISALVLENSRFIFSSKLKWKSYDIKSILENSTNVPVFVDNISLLRAVGYFCINNSEEKGDTLFIDMENGIGAVWFSGGIINSRIPGEIGHTTVEKDGEPCSCGNRGCLEAMCSLKKLKSVYESESGKELSSLAEIERLYKNGDSSAAIAVCECARYLGIGLSNLVNLFNPSSLIIHSGDFSDCPSLFDKAYEELCKRAFPVLTQKLRYETVSISEKSTINGMAYNLCDRIFDISCPDNII